MSFVRLHKVVSYLIAALGLLALSIGPELSLAAEGAILVGFVASWFAEGPRIRAPGWIRGWTVGLVGLLGLQVLRGILGASPLSLALEFTAMLQISRLFNRRGAREHQQIGALALIQLIAATVLSTELSYALAFLGFVIVTPWTLALGHLRAEIEAQQRSRGGDEAERERAVRRVLASRRLVGPGFLAGTAALALPLFAMTGLLFVAFPRVGLGFLSFGRGTGQRVTGFGADVELGDFGVIRSDPTVVLRVTPPELPENPPPRASIRMRGTSFDRYDGRRWTRGHDLEGETVGRSDAFYAVPERMPRPGRDRPWEVVLDPLDEPVIFLPPDTVGLEVPPRTTGGIDVGREIVVSPGRDIRYADADGLGLRYTAWTSDQHPPVEPLSPGERARYLAVPDGHARVTALAERWVGGATDDAEKVRRLVARLRDSGEFTYSLQMPEVGERTPLEVFLFEARAGHCEYYSTSLAVMLRGLGIPARNVTGFLGGRYNPYGGYYALSQGDAHSWVEAWLPGRGWVTLDPTPPARDAVRPDAGWLSSVRALVDALRTRWSEDVVGYDLRAQMGLFRQLRRWLAPPSRGAEPAPAEETAERTSSSPVPGWVWLAVAALVAVGAGLAMRSRRRAGDDGDEDPSGAVALYRALDATLAQLGYARPPDRTPLEHVEALDERGFAELGLVREVTRRYLDTRFGGAPLPAGERDRLFRALEDLRGRRDLRAVSGS
ncbi:MAG TPA: transglutaminaseTgpA domain-containing protein [Sandaracinaceae bacterium LLY-WYZ-13_1]|nr:transglutaminaseTgpA domain-containing protein [Sandaracinaceae bacterium LLY-WYZ-13_1]